MERAAKSVNGFFLRAVLGSAPIVVVFALFFALSVHAATSHCYQWEITTSWYNTGYVSTGTEACDLVRTWAASNDLNMNRLIYGEGASRTYRNIVVQAKTAVPGTWPMYGCWFSYEYKGTGSNPTPSQWTSSGMAKLVSTGYRNNPAGCKVFVSRRPTDQAHCGNSCNSVGDPIDPASGGVFHRESDVSTAGLTFRRYYNSADATSGPSGQSWRHSYSRSIKPVSSSSVFHVYSASPDNSSLYSSEESACLSGFSQIKDGVDSWTSASASYVGNQCVISSGGVAISRLPLLYQSPPTPTPGSTVVVGYSVVRDDGAEISFAVDGTEITAPAGSTLILEKTSSGYKLTNAMDDAEIYDASGKLSSVTSRNGIVEGLEYDSSGRLSKVSDNFGHRINLDYDASGRLQSVTTE